MRLREHGLVTDSQQHVWNASILLGERQDQEVIEMAEGLGAAGRINTLAAVAMARIGDRERALQIAKRALERRDPWSELTVGRVMEEVGDLDCALVWYERAAKRMDRERPIRAMGKALLQLGDYGEAAWALSQSVRMSRYIHDEDIAQLEKCLRNLGRDKEAAELNAAMGGNLKCEPADVR